MSGGGLCEGLQYIYQIPVMIGRVGLTDKANQYTVDRHTHDQRNNQTHLQGTYPWYKPTDTSLGDVTMA